MSPLTERCARCFGGVIMRLHVLLRLVAIGIFAGHVAAAGAGDRSLSRHERAMLDTFAGWPIAWDKDDSNRGSGKPLAIAVGARLFFAGGLSKDGTISCATCHIPGRGFTDGRARARGLANLPRNTPTLLDSRWQRWYGWGGAHDNLWSQTLKAVVTPAEMAGTPAQVKAYLLSDVNLACAIDKAFDVRLATLAPEASLVLATKALAAYQETLVSAPSAFDRFINAVKANDAEAAAQYPVAALRGYRLFVGAGRCHLCHLGPRFTNDEFATAGVPYFTDDGVDKGRYQGVKRLKGNRYSRLGSFTDAPDSPRARFTRFAKRNADLFGAFKVPSLRNLVHTAPYMHDGSLATLADVVEHYSQMNEERLHNIANSLLRALKLSAQEKAGLQAFLESLSAALPTVNHAALMAPLESCRR